MKQETETGIGRALRAARQRRGKSLEEASRDTRVRLDYLDALERERFDALGSEVYVRGFLRSYARYLGLKHDKVIAVYERARNYALENPAEVQATLAKAAATKTPRREQWAGRSLPGWRGSGHTETCALSRLQ
jgi:cytoskeletal protein RodZ